MLDTDNVEAMLARGYAIAKQTLDTVFRNGTQDIEYIQKIAALLYPRSGRVQYRQTSEIVVQNLNKMTKMLAKKKALV